MAIGQGLADIILFLYITCLPSQGAMQKHLMHLAAHAASKGSEATGLVAKAAGIAVNPFDCLAQVGGERGI